MYIKLSTLEFPRYEGDIRLEHPEIPVDLTGSAFPCPETYAPVREIPAPTFDPDTQICQPSQPVQDEDGIWKMTWVVTDLTTEEQENLRQAREELEADFGNANLNQNS